MSKKPDLLPKTIDFLPKTIDLLPKIYQINEKINDPLTTLNDIKRYIAEMRSIVDHAKLIYYKAEEILNDNMHNLEKKVIEITNEDNEEEYSTDWVNFMHKEYSIENSDREDELNFVQQNQRNRIKLTKALYVKENSFISINDQNEITLKLHHLTLTTSISEIEKIIFEYSPDIIKYKNKSKRHIGPLKSLETDLARLESHRILFKEEKNKIKNHIIYNTLLYLLLEE